MKPIIFAAAFLAAAGSLALAQVTTRDRPAPALAGTAVVAGRVTVLDAKPAAPVRRAKVTLESAALGEPRTTDTDTDGRFRFAGLPAGSYRVRAEKAGFVALEFSATRAFVQPEPLHLKGGESVTADIALPRGAALEGRIVNEDGEPVQNLVVSAVRLAYGPTGRRPTAVRQARTDDLGRYRVHSLPPGDYYVDAAPDPIDAAAEIGLPGVRPPGPSRTYFPGTPQIHQARRVTLGLGENAGDVNFALGSVPLARVTIRVIDSSGQPVPRPGVRIQRVGAAPGEVAGFGDPRTPGTFLFGRVPPGEYWVMAAHVPADGVREFAMARLSVAGQDVPDLTVATSKGAVVEGRVEVEGAGLVPEAIEIATLETEFELPNPRPGGPTESIRVDREGRFRIPGLFGPRIVRVHGLPARWALSRVSLGEQDITDAVTDFKAGNAPLPMRVVVTNRTGSVSVAVTDARSRPRPRMRVVVFAGDERRWGATSRFVKAALSRADGAAVIEGLLPGTYLVAVVDHLDDGAWLDPEVLGRLRRGATPIDVAAGDTDKLTVKTGGAS